MPNKITVIIERAEPITLENVTSGLEVAFPNIIHTVTDISPKIKATECIAKAWRYCDANAKEPCGYEPLTEAEIAMVKNGVSFMRDKCLDIIEEAMS